MALKKSELYSSLWSSCDELRGGMDASQYKDYVLVLLFVKYVSDKYAGVPYAPITIPEGASFKDMVALKGKTDIGDQINKKIIGPLAKANKLSDMPDFNDATKLGSGKKKKREKKKRRRKEDVARLRRKEDVARLTHPCQSSRVLFSSPIDTPMSIEPRPLFFFLFFFVAAFRFSESLLATGCPMLVNSTRYATFGFMHEANLDEGAMWPTAFALKELTAAEEARIGALVKKAVS